MAYEHIGKNFTPPDIYGKVTGKAKYAEDYRAEGMAFCRLLLSPMPHAKVRNIDASAALKLKGVLGILTADDVPAFPPPNNTILTNEPHYVGDPVLAVAAESEQIAHDAIELIKVDYEPLPFVVDPLQSLHPGGPTARLDGNVANPKIKYQTIKWTARDFATAGEGNLPMGKPAGEWSYGDIEAGFKEAKVVLDESFVIGAQPHHCMEPRSAMAYWQNGKVYVFGSSQSQSFMVPGLARYCGVKPQDLVYVAEYCGGGFGSKGTPYPQMSIPAHMSRKIKRPVMMRVARHEEYRDRLRPRRLPGPGQGRVRGRRADHRAGRLCGRGKRRQYRLLGLCELRPYVVGGLSAESDALARHPGPHQHADARTAARAGRKPDRVGDGANPRQGGAPAQARSGGDPQDQCAR